MGDALAQLRQTPLQALAVLVERAGKGDVDIRLAFVTDQFQRGRGLLHMAGLAHPGLVEADELGGFGAVAEAEFLARV
ncbi:hypothetical protein FQZ97_1169540 [compost metagenome]